MNTELVKASAEDTVSPFTKSKQSAHLLDLYEEAHGIPAGTLARLGWIECTRKNRPALRFPVGKTFRWRFMDDQAPKYDQATDYHPLWFGLQRAVASARKQGLDYLVDCNGAASAIAADCRGVPAFSLQSGESTTPDKARLAELAAAWQGTIYVCFDNDQDGVGHRAAVNRVRVYRSLGLSAEALDLDLPLDGGDLADFCRLHEAASSKRLLDCPRLPIPAVVERKPYVPRDKSEADQIAEAQFAMDALVPWRRDSYDSWVEIGMALTPLGEAGLSLWEHWSSASDSYKPGQCAKKWASFKKTGRSLGTLFYYATTDFGPTWRPYRPPERPEKPLDAAPAVHEEQYPPMLPIAVRAALNAYAYPSIGPVLELWFEGMAHGYIIGDEPQTFECLKYIAKELKRGVSDQTIRRGLQEAADPHGADFLSVLQHRSNTNTDSGESLESPCDKTEKNPCRNPGRPADFYQLRPWKTILANLAKLAVAPILEKAFPADDPTVAPIRAEFLAELGQSDAESLAEELNRRYGALIAAQPGFAERMKAARKEYAAVLWGLENPLYNAIPDEWTYTNATEYVSCCARAYLELAGGDTHLSRRWLVLRIGCTDRNLASVLNKAGVLVKKNQYADMAVDNLKQLRAIKGYSPAMRGSPVAVRSTTKQSVFPFEKPGMLTWAENELRAGASLFVRYQTANRQRIVTSGQPKRALPRLAWWAMLALRSLLAFVLSLLQAQSPEPVEDPDERIVERPERTFRDVMAVHPWVRLHVQLRLKTILEWVCRNYRPKRKRATYGEVHLQKVLNLARGQCTDGERLVDPDTGEVFPYSVQLTLDFLLPAQEAVA